VAAIGRRYSRWLSLIRARFCAFCWQSLVGPPWGDRYLPTDTLLSLMMMFVTKQIGREEPGIGWVGKMGVQLRDHPG